MNYYYDLWNEIINGWTMLAACISIIASVIANWIILEKSGNPGWISLIPFVNVYYLYKITFGSGWYMLLLFIPIVNVICSIVFCVKLAKVFGCSGLFALGLIVLPTIFKLILAFSSTQYQKSDEVIL